MAKTPHIALAALLVTSLVGVAAPASAHECASYDGKACDADACTEGEDHKHTNYNTVGRDESCKSTAEPEEEEECRVLTITVPDFLCGRNDSPTQQPPV